MKSVINRKIQLMPHSPKNDTECQCPTCGGIGYLLEDDKWLVQCTDCYNGIVPVCEYCGSPKKKSSYSCKCTNTECNWKEFQEINRKSEFKNKEKERVNKAKHYSPADCPRESCEMLYSEIYGYNEGYFSEIDDLEEYCEDNNFKMPDYVWGTTKLKFSLDATDFVESRLEDSYEDVWNNVDNRELAKLQIACDEFVNNQDGYLDTYYVDYSVCIDLTD